MKDFFIEEIKEIFSDSPFSSVKDNVFYQEEFPDDKRPEDLEAFILIDFEQTSNDIRGYYNYIINFTFVYNGVSRMKEVSAMEDYFDMKFEERLKLQNKSGLWFAEPYKNSMSKADGGTMNRTVLTSTYMFKVYFK